jgi:hypothetical protein
MSGPEDFSALGKMPQAVIKACEQSEVMFNSPLG